MALRLPRHVGFIPDGNRRWALARGLPKQAGYSAGISPGVELCEQCIALGIPEVSIYGFTQDNVRRPSVQRTAFSAACVQFAQAAGALGCSVRTVGDHSSAVFPRELADYVSPAVAEGALKVNLLVNYGWEWDVSGLKDGGLRSADVPRLDLIVRWGGGRRLSGFLPIQSVYADIFVVDDYWPDFVPAHFDAALEWYSRQDRTLGG
ncbi:MAG: undecaprenyl diphosphate synthase family protein [bacterium]|nr:undecaprenyl diphosphate synthase family protein [bacterium]